MNAQTIWNDGSKQMARPADNPRERGDYRREFDSDCLELRKAIKATFAQHGAEVDSVAEITIKNRPWYVVTITYAGGFRKLPAVDAAYVNMSRGKSLRAYMLWLICPPPGMKEFDPVVMFKLVEAAGK